LKKCYIAGKITGLPESEYKANFEAAKKEVEALGYIPVSPVDLPHDHDMTWESYMKEGMVAMMGCEVIFMIKNWLQSPGATIEFETAYNLNYSIIYQY